MAAPTISEVKALDGKIFAMLSTREEETLNYFRQQGRKFGVSVTIKSEADPEEIKQAASVEQADQIMKRANSRVSVTVSNA